MRLPARCKADRLFQVFLRQPTTSPPLAQYLSRAQNRPQALSCFPSTGNHSQHLVGGASEWHAQISDCARHVRPGAVARGSRLPLSSLSNWCDVARAHCCSLCSTDSPVSLCPLLSLLRFLLCSEHCRKTSLLLKVAVHLQEQRVLLVRHGLNKKRRSFKKIHYRRNGWDVKPRHGKDPNALVVEDKWWHDSSKSVYWQYFKDDTSFNECTVQAVEFYDEFHMPRAVFRDLYSMFKDTPGFKDKKRGDKGRGMRTQPLLLKVCALVYILTDGGARPIYRAAQRACLSEKCVRTFMYRALEHLHMHHFSQHVFLPKTHAELQRTERKYARSGFPGAFISLDVVHCAWIQCPMKYTHLCSGKEGFPTLAWNCGVDRNGICTHISGPHLGARNDKTIALVDELIQTLHNNLNQLFSDYVFGLTDEHGFLQRLKGVYALVDGGYHFWRCLICGNAHEVERFAARFAKRLESVRKDPERFFGILKKRFYSLDGGMKWRDPKHHHHAFCVCAMLHNMIARHRKYHTVGEDPDDWIKARIVTDDERLRRQPQYAGRGASLPHPEKHDVGNVTAKLRDPAFFALRRMLVANYRHLWERQLIFWLKPMSQLRKSWVGGGGGREAQDTRPLLPGRARRGAVEPSPHAWCSDGEDDEGGGEDDDADGGREDEEGDGDGEDGGGSEDGEEGQEPTAPTAAS